MLRGNQCTTFTFEVKKRRDICEGSGGLEENEVRCTGQDASDSSLSFAVSIRVIAVVFSPSWDRTS